MFIQAYKFIDIFPKIHSTLLFRTTRLLGTGKYVFVEKSTKAPRQYEICLSYEYVLSKCLHIPSPEENMKYGSKLKEYIENSKSSKRKFSRTSCGIFHERSKKVLKFLMEIW